MIPIAKLRIGNLDAKNEIFQQERENSHVFHNSFVMPPSVNFEKLISGSCFFIQGPKGSGKTALLRYLMYVFQEMNYQTQIVLFKSDLTETERQKLIQLNDMLVFSDQRKIEVAYDYKQNWLWFILRQFAKQIADEDVEKGAEYLQDLKKIMGVSNERESVFSGLQLTKIKGMLDLAFKSNFFNSSFRGEIEAISQQKNRQFEEVVFLCEKLIKNVKIKGGKKFAVIFDELELFLLDKDQRTRDLFLIRDLIYAVSRFNRMVGSGSPNLVVYAALRSEILVEINRVGPEIGRDVEDLGVSVE